MEGFFPSQTDFINRKCYSEGSLFFFFKLASNLLMLHSYNMGFPGSSVGKESACNAGDPGSIPGLGRSSGEGIGYPLQYS